MSRFTDTRTPIAIIIHNSISTSYFRFIFIAENPRYNGSVYCQRFSKVEFVVMKKLDRTYLYHHTITNTLEQFLLYYNSYVLLICKNRLGEAIQTKIQNVCFPGEKHGTINKKKSQSADFSCRPNWRYLYNEFCCYNECLYKEGTLYFYYCRRIKRHNAYQAFSKTTAPESGCWDLKFSLGRDMQYRDKAGQDCQNNC